MTKEDMERIRRAREEQKKQEKEKWRKARERITKKKEASFDKDLESMKKTDNEYDQAMKKFAKDIDEVEQSLEDKIMGFDKNHIPKYSQEYLAKNCPQRDNEELRIRREKLFAGIIKDTVDNRTDNRTGINRYRVCLVKTRDTDLEETLKKTVQDVEKDRAEGKPIPSLIHVSPNGEIEGVPVPVDVYLRETNTKTLSTDAQGKDNRAAVIEAVYNEKPGHKYELEYDKSIIPEKELTKEKEQGGEKEEPVKVKQGRVVHNQVEEANLEGERLRKDAEIRDMDMWGFDDAGVNRDVTPISDLQNMDTQKSHKIAQAFEAEQYRLNDIDTHQEVPEATQERVSEGEEYHDSPYHINPQKGADAPEWDEWEKEQIHSEKAKENLWSAKDFEDLNLNGLDDREEAAYYEDLNGNGVPDIEEPRKLSWREQIEEQDRKDWEQDMERTYGS